MNYLAKSKLKVDIAVRKTALNLTLKFLHPTHKFSVYLSQNLDKYITDYQKDISSQYFKKNEFVTNFDKLVSQ